MKRILPILLFLVVAVQAQYQVKTTTYTKRWLKSSDQQTGLNRVAPVGSSTNSIIKFNGLNWVEGFDGGGSGSGDVTGPGSSTDNAVPRWNGAGGDTLQDSGVLIDDDDNVTVPGRISTGDGSIKGQLRLGDDNNDHYIFFTPSGTTTTDSFFVYPAAPATGFLLWTLSSSTNLTGSFISFTGTGTLVRSTDPVITGSLAIPQDNNPTVNSAGEIAVDVNDHSIRFFGSAERVIGSMYVASMTIFDPDGVQATSDAIPILPVEATWAPFGITVRDIYLKTDASSTYSIDLEEWTTIAGGTVTQIESAIATSGSLEAEDDGTLNDASVAAGSIVFVDLPATAVNFITVTFTYTINAGN